MENIDVLTTGLMVLFVFLGLLAVGLSVLMILRRVTPDMWFGIRTYQIPADDEVWYKANAFSGRLLFAMGISWAVIAVVLRYVPPIGTNPAIYGAIVGLIVVTDLAAVFILSLNRLRSL